MKWSKLLIYIRRKGYSDFGLSLGALYLHFVKALKELEAEFDHFLISKQLPHQLLMSFWRTNRLPGTDHLMA